MLSIDHLHEMTKELDRCQSVENDPTIGQLNRYLRDIYERREYQSWLEIDQYSGAIDTAGRFSVPAELGIMHSDAKRILDRFLLTSNRVLNVKIDQHFGCIHLTDGFWVDAQSRVFPTADESENLCRYIKAAGYDGLYDTLIDPACGSGHHAMALDFPVKCSMDISLRALAFTRLNAILQGAQSQNYLINDIRDGLPSLFRSLRGTALVAINMPFALFPKVEGERPMTAQDGGLRGIALTTAALEAVSLLWKQAAALERLRACVLFYSLGRGPTGPWEVEEVARNIFDGVPARLKILSDEKMWRVNGKKEQPNPMLVDKLETKAACRFTWPEYMEQSMREGYRRRQMEYRNAGWTHLGYGVLDVELVR